MILNEIVKMKKKKGLPHQAGPLIQDVAKANLS